MYPEHLHILQHSLGVDQYGGGKRRYRNRFVTGLGSSDWTLCLELCALGLMEDLGAYSLCAGDHVFAVTAKGIDAVEKQSPKPPKLTRSQSRYRKFLSDDCGLSFGEWLKIKTDRYSSEFNEP